MVYELVEVGRVKPGDAKVYYNLLCGGHNVLINALYIDALHKAFNMMTESDLYVESSFGIFNTYADVKRTIERVQKFNLENK